MTEPEWFEVSLEAVAAGDPEANIELKRLELIAVCRRLLGSDWPSRTVAEWMVALDDESARRTAEDDQFLARHNEERHFIRAVIAAMEAKGATYGHEVYDDVARELYGGHTPLTRRVIRETTEDRARRERER